MAVSLSNLRALLLPGLWAVSNDAGKNWDVTTEPPEVNSLDPAFSLDELEAAQATIDSLKK